MENSSWFLFIVVIVSFYVGFKIVGFIITKINGRSNNGKRDDGHSFEQQYSQNYYNGYQNPSPGSFSYGQPGEDTKEQHYAKVLGLEGRNNIDEIRRRYKDLIAKYHPDKVYHLGTEFKEMAELKTVEIIEAYRYFQKKYNIQ